MNWRRGILLAGIHLAVAVPLMVWAEATWWPFIRTDANTLTDAEKEQITEGELITSPCYGWQYCWPVNPERGEVVPMDNLPIALLSGWHEPCKRSSRIDAVVEGRLGRTRRSEIVTVSILFLGAAIQWLLIGGFPLTQPKRWWLEPGVFITACTLIGVFLVFVPYAHALARIPILSAVLAWFWWFGLLVWTGVPFGWKRAARKSS
jgi:hypothetical protein